LLILLSRLSATQMLENIRVNEDWIHLKVLHFKYIYILLFEN